MAGDDVEWTSEQMIENAYNWSLAGDVALLNRLKKFSKFLLSETVSISDNVDNLLNNLETVSLKLDLTRNEFHSLRNTQFIENRVYEDDETLETKETKKVEKEYTEEEKNNVIREALMKGLEVMDKYYEKIEVSVSDSDEEECEKSYILRAKDPYVDRPLPYLVGTEEWYKKWHVGLLPSDSESESEKEEEMYSSSDLEEGLPKDKNLGSETSSELDFVNKSTGPVANSTFNDSQDRTRKILHSDESSEQNSSVPVKTPISDKNFAEQLTAKLGDVINGSSDNLEHVNRNPIKRKNQSTKYGILFSDEPPPLDELDDTVLPKSAQEGLFTVGRDLFGESTESNQFWDPTNKISQNIKISEEQSVLVNQPDNKSKFKISKGLFDESDSSEDDDMFTVVEKRKVKSAQPYLQPFKPTVPFVDDQPPEITSKSDNVASKKKPVGGVSIFGEDADIFSDTSGKPSFESGKPSTSSILTPNINPKSTGAIKKTLKKTSLFDESSDEDITPKNKRPLSTNFKDRQSIKKFNLFDDSDDILQPKIQENLKTSEERNKFSLFDDDDNFSTSKEENVDQSQESKKKVDLFDETSDENVDIFRPSTKKIDAKTAILTKSDIENKKPRKKISLFDDDDDFLKVEEDIFASATKKTSLFDDFDKKPEKNRLEGLFQNTEGASSSQSSETISKTHSTRLFDNLETEYSPELLPESSGIKSKLEQESSAENLILSKEKLGKKSTKTLFDDLEVSGSPEDLFGSIKTQNTSQNVDYLEKKITKVLLEDSESSKSATSLLEDSRREDIDVKSLKKITNLYKVVDKTLGREDSEEKAVKDIKGNKKFEEKEVLFEADKLRKTIEENVVKQKGVSLFKDGNNDDFFSDNKTSFDKNDCAETTNKDELKENQEDIKEIDLDKKNLKNFEAIDTINKPEKDEPNNSSKDASGHSKVLLKQSRNNPLEQLRKNVSFHDSDSGSSDDDFGFGEKTKDREGTSNEQSATKNDDEYFKENVWLRATTPKSFGLSEQKYDDERLAEPSNTERKESESNIEINDSTSQHNKASNSNVSKNYTIPPPLDLFDPTPPPLDWDAGSDNSGESDTFSLSDGLLNQTNFNQSQARSSLFDEAPPSLDANESSGIVRDLNVTRVETDDSSFYPYASSSRRLSSDIFGEEQSQDGFFITKNRTESAQSGATLDKIPEDVQNTWSKIENLTPSGNLEDFEGSSVFESRNLSKEFESMDDIASVSEINSTCSLEDNMRHSQGEDVSASKRLTNIKQRASLFEQNPNLEEQDKTKEKNDDVKKKPYTSPVKTSPGKLQHNLQINVSALMPGAARPKIRSSVAKSTSPDETDRSTLSTDLPVSGTSSTPSPTSGIATSKSESLDGLNQAAMLDSSEKFGILSQTEVLQSATKDRVKIPVKRKPSTRRARQEAVRKSMTDFGLYQNENGSSVDNEQSSENNKTVQNKLEIRGDDLEQETPTNEDSVQISEDKPEVKGISPVFGKMDKKEAKKRKDLLESPASEGIFGSSSFTEDDSLISSGMSTEEASKSVITILEPDNASLNSQTASEKEGSKRETKTFEDLFEDETDLFKLTSKTDEISKEVKKDNTIFKDGGSDSDEDLFSSTAKSHKKDAASTDNSSTVEDIPSKKYVKSVIFSDKSDSDGDDDPFSGKLQVQTASASKKVTVKKASIFDDSDDNSEDDLFVSKSSKSRSGRVGDFGSTGTGAVLGTKRVESKNVKVAGVKKLENKEVTDFDPLSAFK